MRGHTIIELSVVLSLTAVTAASLAPTARAYRDRAAVLAAREALVGLLAEARATAMEGGAARVRLEAGPWTAWSSAGDSTLRLVALETDLGVAVELSGARTTAEIDYGPLGLGRFANETVGFRRGNATAGLVVSSYGRVRRR